MLSVAACSNVMPAGFGASCFSVGTVNSAKLPSAAPSTSSPA
jgi:hypothetical protein